MARSTINNGDTGLVVRNALNAMLLELYGAITQPDYVVGRWYTPFRATTTTGGVGQNTIQFAAFVLLKPVTISDLGCAVITALAANNVQLAIYAADPATFYPTGNPLAVTGNISTAVAGPLSADITGANVVLPAGLYHAAVNHSGATSTVLGISNGFPQTPPLIGSTTLANLVNGTGGANLRLTFASAFGTWPDMTGQALTESQASVSPVLYFKAA